MADLLAGAAGLTAGVAAGLKEGRQQKMIQAKMQRSNAQTSAATALELLSYDIPETQKEQILLQLPKMMKMGYGIEMSPFIGVQELKGPAAQIFKDMLKNKDNPEKVASLNNALGMIGSDATAGLTPEVDGIMGTLGQGILQGGGLTRDTAPRPAVPEKRPVDYTFAKKKTAKKTWEEKGDILYEVDEFGKATGESMPIPGVKAKAEKERLKAEQAKEKKLGEIAKGTANMFFSNGDPVPARLTNRELGEMVKSKGYPLKLTTSQANGLVTVEPVMTRLNEMEKIALKHAPEASEYDIVTGGKRLYAGASNLWDKLMQSKGSGAELRTYSTSKKALSSRIAKLGGEAGMLTDADIERFNALMADILVISDTKETVKESFRVLRGIVNGGVSNFLAAQSKVTPDALGVDVTPAHEPTGLTGQGLADSLLEELGGL